MLSMRSFRVFCLAGVWVVLMFLFSFIVSNANPVEAKQYHFEEINVDIEVMEDSSMEITEEIVYQLDGEFHAFFREITLLDNASIEACKSRSDLQCGGFEYIEILGVYDNDDQLLDFDEYTVETVYNSYSDEDRLKVQWIFSEPGIIFNNESYKYTIKYKVYGGLGYFPEEGYDLFYWDTIFPDRTEIVDKVDVGIKFPGDISLEAEDLIVFGHDYTYYWDYFPAKKLVTIQATNIAPYEDFSVLLKISKRDSQRIRYTQSGLISK